MLVELGMAGVYDGTLNKNLFFRFVLRCNSEIYFNNVCL